MESEEFKRAVEANLDRDPHQIALDRKVPNAAAVASQVKYLKRAERKLPSYYTGRCLLPPLAFEQSSSEQTAARKNYSGRLCIDLTCGLGVDSFHLAKKFERVIAVEHDPELAAIARENFRRLGAHNIEVVNASAEDFLANFASTDAETHTSTDLKADLIYADPDRRNAEGKKMVRIEDCSPDITTLLPAIKKTAPRLVVKLSPLFDVDEVFRIFGPHTRVEVISLGGECKEIVADVALKPENTATAEATPTIRAVAMGLGEAEYPFGDDRPTPPQEFTPDHYRYLVIPDVALQKARLARRYFSEYGGIYIDSDNGYGFAAKLPAHSSDSHTEPPLMGKIIEIQSIESFDPKALKRRLKAQNIKSIDILRRNFPLLSATDLTRQLGIRESGKTGANKTNKTSKATTRPAIAFTRAADRLWQVYLTNL